MVRKPRFFKWLVIIFVFTCGCGGPEAKSTIHQTSGPVTVEQARERLKMPLPDSAKNVQYALYQEWQALVELVYFEAPLEDCLAFANDIITTSKIKELRDIDRTGADLTQPQPPKDTSGLSAPWFDPQNIHKGLVAGETGSHVPCVWIDTDRGAVYYLYTD